MTSSPHCKNTHVSYTNVFAVPLVNGTEVEGSALSNFNSFMSTVMKDCIPLLSVTAASPDIKTPVSALTVTRTSYFSSARIPTVILSPSPTAQNPMVSSTSTVHRQNDFETPNASPKLFLSQGSQPVSDLSPLLTSIPKPVSKPQPNGPNTAALISIDTPLPPLPTNETSVLSNSASEYLVSSQTLIPGSSTIAISSKPPGNSPNSAALIGSATPLSPLSIDGTVISLNSASEYLNGKQTLIPGSPAITILGTPISLAQSASNFVIGGSTTTFVDSVTRLPPLTIDGTKILPNSASEYLVGSQTLIPGSSAITISSKVISLVPSASALIIDSSTIPLRSGLTATTALRLPLIAIGNSFITPNSASQYIIAGQTLFAGGSAVTVSGTRISLAPQASDVIFGNSTEGLGSLVPDGIGAATLASVNVSVSATGPDAYRSAATTVYGQMWIVAIVIFGLGFLL